MDSVVKGFTMSQWTRGTGFSLFSNSPAANSRKQPVTLTGYSWKAE